MTAESGLGDAGSIVDRSTLVVGHDGSPGADQALAEALGLARALGGRVVLVRAWSLATAPRPADWEFGYVPGFNDYAETVRLALIDDVRSAVEGFSDVPLEYRAVHAGAAKSLVEISEGALMLGAVPADSAGCRACCWVRSANSACGTRRVRYW